MTVGVASPIIVPLDTAKHAADAIEHIEMAMQLASVTLTKAPVYGEAAALAGVRQILDALAVLLA